MKKNILLILLAVTVLTTLNLSAQQRKANLSFETMHHDYGKIKEEAGVSKFKFTFANTGGEPLIIQDVKPSCGCTSSDWTKNPIPPGGNGFITADYNPKNRPGKFSKSIRVTTNAQPAVSVLRISGEVIPKEKTLEDLYPSAVGGLRMKTSHLAFMKIVNTEVKTETVEIVNNINEVIDISFKSVPEFIQIKAEPASLKPKEKGKLIVTYDPTKKNDWGFVINRIEITTTTASGKSQCGKLSVSAVIEEDFSKLTEEELANAPVIKFDSKIFDFGPIKQGESVDYEYTFTNEGKSDLIIRKTKASCGCTAIMPGENIIPPGGKGSIKVKFNSRGKKGPQNKSITITNNDPNNPSLQLRIKGNVELPK